MGHDHLTIDETHDPLASSWVPGADEHADFPVQNLPLGIFSPPGDALPRGGVAIGDQVLDLDAASALLEGEAVRAARLAVAPSLNALFTEGNGLANALRQGVFGLLTDRARANTVRAALYPAADCTLHLPFAIADYTDFYAGINHAENVGRLFRPDNPLLPNYKHVPIGYHGRASSIRPSGNVVRRPNGQRRAPDADVPVFGPTQRLDYELEMAIWVGKGNTLGAPVPIAEADGHIAGLSILNDWSARDFQAWEYQPLGPFLAKNFHSTISPWVVTAAALQPFRVAQPERPEGDPAPLPYLYDARDQATGAYAVKIEVHLITARMRMECTAPFRLSRGPMTSMYWTAAQLIAHHTVNGCNLQAGDLLGTGTLSGVERDSFGSLLELTEGGKRAISLPNGEQRTFLEDGDEIVMTATAEAEGYRRIGFGECRASVVG